MHVDGIRMRSQDQGDGRYGLQGLVRIVDQSGMPVPEATVEAVWTTPSGATRPQQRLTNLAGVARFGLTTRQTGAHTLCVTDVSATGHLYDPGQNEVTCGEVVLP